MLRTAPENAQAEIGLDLTSDTQPTARAPVRPRNRRKTDEQGGEAATELSNGMRDSAVTSASAISSRGAKTKEELETDIRIKEVDMMNKYAILLRSLKDSGASEEMKEAVQNRIKKLLEKNADM